MVWEAGDVWDRRELLKTGMCLAAATALGRYVFAAEGTGQAAGAERGEAGVREALWYEKLDDGRVKCGLCPKGCEVGPGGRGACGVRENRGGTYYTLVYGRACAVHVDPIEKKPLFHYLPGTTAFSYATGGCNFRCKFCQNWDISQARPEELQYRRLTPAEIVGACREGGIPTIASTYSEPTVSSEYTLETAKAGRAAEVGTVIISNGFMSRRAMVDLCGSLTAVKIDLKGFTEKFYREVCGGELKPVLDTLRTLKELKIHYEIVVLLIPTLNDSKEEVKEMCGWIVKELGPEVPVHFSRFQPMYRMTNLPPTPISTMESAYEVARGAGVKYCYLGNVGAHKWANTYCPKCETMVIERYGNMVRRNSLAEGKCPKCALAIPGVWTQKQALAFKAEAVKN